MKVKELIKLLQNTEQEAEVEVIVDTANVDNGDEINKVIEVRSMSSEDNEIRVLIEI